MYSLEEVKDIVERERQERTRYVQRALNWENMYFSRQWDKDPKKSVEEEGKELITLPTAFNTVHLGLRLISTTPKIECPPAEATGKGDTAALKRQRWLHAMYQRCNAQQQQDIIGALAWYSLVRGRHAVQVAWIYDVLPKTVRNKKFPILVRPLDPFGVGVIRGPYGTDFAYVMEEDVPLWRLKQQFSKLNVKETRKYPSGSFGKSDDDTEHTVIDAWWADRDTGKVWNAVVVDDVFAKEPVETDYPEVPIIEGYGDTTYAFDPALRGLSIVAGMESTWPYMNRLTSQLATGMLWYFWPHIAVEEPEGGTVDENINVRPGRTQVYPAGTNIRMVQMEPNVPLARELLGQLEQIQQQSTFPGVMYGEAGSMQAGYGVNLLTQSASGRTMSIRRNLEMTLESVNRIALGMVDSKALGGKVKGGVTAWGQQDGDGLYEVALTAKDIEGFYENSVKLGSETFADEMQKVAIGIQMVQAGLISADTFRNHILPIKIPSDEQRRVELEGLMKSDEMKQKVLATTVIAYYPDIWREIVAGTPLEAIAYQTAGEQPPMPPGGPPQGGPPPAPGGPMGPGGPPPDAPPGPGPGGPGGPPPGPGGIPPEIMAQLPPELQGAPPEVIMQFLQQQGMGPGGPPPGPPQGGPPQQGEMMPLQPDAIPMPQGGGIPPEMQGQLTPEMVGGGQQIPEELWALMTGDPMTDQQILQQYLERGG